MNADDIRAHLTGAQIQQNLIHDRDAGTLLCGGQNHLADVVERVTGVIVHEPRVVELAHDSPAVNDHNELREVLRQERHPRFGPRNRRTGIYDDVLSVLPLAIVFRARERQRILLAQCRSRTRTVVRVSLVTENDAARMRAQVCATQ